MRTRGYNPVDVLMLGYLALTAGLLVFSPLACPNRGLLVATHMVLLVAVFALRFVPRRHPAWVRVVRDWYPMAALPFFYRELEYLSRLITDGYHDEWVVSLDQAIFGFQPSQQLFRMIPLPAVSEFLHFAYFAYIPSLAAVGLWLYLTRRIEEHRVYVTSLMATFFVCYTIFIFVPVTGPFHHFGPIDPAVKQAFFAQIIHNGLLSASSVGTAWPSSHVAVGVVMWLVSWRFLRRLRWATMVIAIGIFFGTVYGGYHYASDAIAGLALGLAMGWSGPAIHRTLERYVTQ